MKTNQNQRTFKLISSFATIALLIALMPSFANGQGMNDIQWHSSVERAKEIAKQQNKLVLLHFGAEWCRPCRALETYVFRAGAVKKAIAENVVPVKLDADKALAIVNEYDVSMVPFDVIITPNGRVVTERRSPADAENYAKMISSTSNASRILEKEKLGPIAHQQVIKNRSLSGQNATDFRVNGPEAPEMGLSKDGSLLQRRQTAFSDDSNAIRKTNPFVAGAVDTVVADAAPAMQEDQTVSVEDLQRDQFLSQERNWAAPVEKTRRAKPERIVNERYFEKFSQLTPPKTNASPTPSNAVANAYVPQSAAAPLQAPQFGAPQMQVPNNPGQQYRLASGATAVPNQPNLGPATAVANTAPESIELSFDDAPAQAPATLEMPEELTPPPFSEEGFTFASDVPAASESNPIVEVAPQQQYMEVGSAAQPAPTDDRFSLRGKCPVTLITEGRWQDGDTRWGIVHRNQTYIFANAQALALFRTNPDKYSPVLAGYDPVLYHEQGKLTEGLVENGVFMGQTPNQRVILFIDQQTRAKFQASPLLYLDTIRSATQNAGQGAIIR